MFVTALPDEVDYNVREQYPVLQMKANGLGLLHKNVVQDAVLYDKSLGIPQQMYLQSVRFDPQDFKSFLLDLAKRSPGDDQLQNACNAAQQQLDRVRACTWDFNGYILQFIDIVHHLLELTCSPGCDVTRHEGNYLCRLVALPTCGVVPKSIIVQVVEIVWVAITQAEERCFPDDVSQPKTTLAEAQSIITQVNVVLDTHYGKVGGHGKAEFQLQMSCPPVNIADPKFSKTALSATSVAEKIDAILRFRRAGLLFATQDDFASTYVHACQVLQIASDVSCTMDSHEMKLLGQAAICNLDPHKWDASHKKARLTLRSEVPAFMERCASACTDIARRTLFRQSRIKTLWAEAGNGKCPVSRLVPYNHLHFSAATRVDCVLFDPRSHSWASSHTRFAFEGQPRAWTSGHQCGPRRLNYLLAGSSTRSLNHLLSGSSSSSRWLE